jgi:hypothetical protein
VKHSLEQVCKANNPNSPQLSTNNSDCFQALVKLNKKGFSLANLEVLGPGGIGEAARHATRNATIRTLRSLTATCKGFEASMQVSCQRQSFLHQRTAALHGTMHELVLWVGANQQLRQPKQQQTQRLSVPIMRNVGEYQALIRAQDRL